MATIANAWVQVHPSFIEPELIVAYNQMSGAFDTLPNSEPRVKIGEGDLAVYAKRIDVRTRVGAAQAAFNSLPSCTVVNQMIGTATYLQRVRAEYDHHDTAAAAGWGYSIVEAQRLGMRQGHFQLMRNALLYGYNPANGEGLLNAQGATAVSLPADSNGNDTIVTYDSGQLAFFLTQQLGLLKQRTNQLGIGRKFTFLMPQRVGAQIEYADIVQLMQFQREGAGTMTTAGTVKKIAMDNGDEITWGYDDTLQGKGAGGTDAILIVMPEVANPQGRNVNTNEFAKLAPGLDACTLMYADMAAPREIPVPMPGGTIDVTSEIRVTPGWGVRPEAIVIISAQYQ
ncbi:MAG TPA: DUF2184 domain-containing protein [Stellaceae bacterium]|nr:DUF2184 domain-containing protein [Stellaceae bacterium]